MTAARFARPEKNINFAFADPFLHRPWGPTPVHVGLMWLGLVLAVYVPTHFVLARFFPPPSPRN